MLALVVTAEPFYAGSGYVMRAHGLVISVGAIIDVPVAEISARDVETLVTHEGDFEEVMLNAMHRRAAMLRPNPEGTVMPRRNRILDQAWQSYPWPDGMDDASVQLDVDYGGMQARRSVGHSGEAIRGNLLS
jgi:hypothetical protein